MQISVTKRNMISLQFLSGLHLQCSHQCMRNSCRVGTGHHIAGAVAGDKTSGGYHHVQYIAALALLVDIVFTRLGSLGVLYHSRGLKDRAKPQIRSNRVQVLTGFSD